MTVEPDRTVLVECWQNFTNARERTCQAGTRDRTGHRKLKQQNLIDRAVPMLRGPTTQVAAADQPGVVVVGAEVGSAGMRNLQSQERNVGLQEFGGDHRSYVLVGLKLDHQLHPFAHERLRVAHGGLGTVSVIQNDQLYLGPFGGLGDTLRDSAGEREFLALAGVADAIPLGSGQPNFQAVLLVADSPHQAALLQREEDAIRGRQIQSRTPGNLFEPERLLHVPKGIEYIAGSGHGAAKILTGGPGVCHVVS